MTAIEYFVSKLADYGQFSFNHSEPHIEIIISKYEFTSLIEKVVEMEKQHILDAFWDGGQNVPLSEKACEQYYNKMFNKI